VIVDIGLIATLISREQKTLAVENYRG